MLTGIALLLLILLIAINAILQRRPRNLRSPPPGLLPSIQFLCPSFCVPFRFRMRKSFSGPRGLPLLGYLDPLLTKSSPVFIHMQKLAEIHGPVVGFYVGPRQHFVSVCGYDAVRDALYNDDLKGRPSFNAYAGRGYDYKKGKNVAEYSRTGEEVLDKERRGSIGVMFAVGDSWHEQRRFAIKHLRELSFGTAAIESRMMDEIHGLLEEIRGGRRADAVSSSSGGGRVVDFEGIFTVPAVNVLWSAVGGESFQREDPHIRDILSEVGNFFRAGNVLLYTAPLPDILLKALGHPGGTRTATFPSLRQFIRVNSAPHELSATEN